MCQAALAIDHAHSFGFIHRDLKPDNIFLCKGEGGDNVRVLDFGSVKLQMETGPKLTAFGTTLGSPYYMSPEQAMGKQDVDQRTDVFALSAILYEALTGKIAFEGAERRPDPDQDHQPESDSGFTAEARVTPQARRRDREGHPQGQAQALLRRLDHGEGAL